VLPPIVWFDIYLRKNYPPTFLYLNLLLISIYTIHLFEKLVKRNLQEIIFGRTRRIVPELESWPVQELLGHTP